VLPGDLKGVRAIIWLNMNSWHRNSWSRPSLRVRWRPLSDMSESVQTNLQTGHKKRAYLRVAGSFLEQLKGLGLVVGLSS